MKPRTAFNTYPSRQQLSDMARCSKRTVDRRITEIRELHSLPDRYKISLAIYLSHVRFPRKEAFAFFKLDYTKEEDKAIEKIRESVTEKQVLQTS